MRLYVAFYKIYKIKFLFKFMTKITFLTFFSDENQQK
ncbi:unknown [[Mannheimia] succiniciproducens MBEL55E]|uniref:Uncharacterized protein n=1 Tax=Mannheimia succiniciproducens (strain KCTC 0769BP / MBEL55E) TaxID=221988 RepID=Q65SY3_MANSM|nr:unknown [[Mannheimia] succiniciproducens MBEL55E]